MSEFKHKPNAEQVVERWDRFWAGDDLSPPIHSLRVPGAGLSMGGHGHCDMHEAPDAFFHKMLGAVEARRCLPDDAIPMFIPPFSHAMVPAVFGAEVRLEGRRFFAKPGIRTMAELVETSFSPEAEWWRKVEGFYSRLLDLAHGGRCWVKLSGACRMTEVGPSYDDMTPFAQALIEARPDRMVWATDWPHVALWDLPMPDDANSLDWALSWGVDEATMRAILVDNPAELYGFH